MNEQKYNHKEAFCLMNYRCEKCGKLETLWNSRDGVTPFIIGCKYCGGESRHVAFHLDICSPIYKPKPGQRIFVDMTKEKAKEIAKKRIEMFNDHPVAKERDPEELLESLTKSIWHNGEAPDIVTVE